MSSVAKFSGFVISACSALPDCPRNIINSTCGMKRPIDKFTVHHKRKMSLRSLLRDAKSTCASAPCASKQEA